MQTRPGTRSSWTTWASASRSCCCPSTSVCSRRCDAARGCLGALVRSSVGVRLLVCVCVWHMRHRGVQAPANAAAASWPPVDRCAAARLCAVADVPVCLCVTCELPPPSLPPQPSEQQPCPVPPLLPATVCPVPGRARHPAVQGRLARLAQEGAHETCTRCRRSFARAALQQPRAFVKCFCQVRRPLYVTYTHAAAARSVGQVWYKTLHPKNKIGIEVGGDGGMGGGGADGGRGGGLACVAAGRSSPPLPFLLHRTVVETRLTPCCRTVRCALQMDDGGPRTSDSYDVDGNDDDAEVRRHLLPARVPHHPQQQPLGALMACPLFACRPSLSAPPPTDGASLSTRWPCLP